MEKDIKVDKYTTTPNPRAIRKESYLIVKYINTMLIRNKNGNTTWSGTITQIIKFGAKIYIRLGRSGYSNLKRFLLR
jgi:hypothetical protein